MAEAGEWRFHKFGLIVTGDAEEAKLDRLFRSLADHGNCAFNVIRKIGQLRPKTALKVVTTTPKKGNNLPTKTEETIAQEVSDFLRGSKQENYVHHVVLIDDLEAHDKDLNQKYTPEDIHRRYYAAMRLNLKHSEYCLISMHFLKSMLEAYYFADTRAVNDALGTNLTDATGDAEEIKHPKGDLEETLRKSRIVYKEVEHGKEIIPNLDVPKILSNPETCASLRSLFHWCWRSIGEPEEERFCLENGVRYEVTKDQCAWSASGEATPS